jgi:hypothetical protein
MLAAKLIVPDVFPALLKSSAKTLSQALASGLFPSAVIATVGTPAFLAALAAWMLERVLPDIETKHALRPTSSEGSEMTSVGRQHAARPGER